MALTRVAVYRRRVAASEARVWDNVRDWEHLPWLHRGSFRSIELEEEGTWGWRARVGLGSAPRDPEIRLELVIGPEPRRYVARTLEGPGAGAEIWTQLAPVDEEQTDIAVEFHLPDVDSARADALGAAYVALYTRLWNEDEAMMQGIGAAQERLAARRAGGSPAPPPLALGSLAAVRGRLPFCVEFQGLRWRLVELDGALLVHSALCPHRLGPLDRVPIEDGAVTCPWHGHRFDVRSGESSDGRAARLARAPRIEIDAQGEVRLSSPPAGR